MIWHLSGVEVLAENVVKNVSVPPLLSHGRASAKRTRGLGLSGMNCKRAVHEGCFSKGPCTREQPTSTESHPRGGSLRESALFWA